MSFLSIFKVYNPNYLLLRNAISMWRMFAQHFYRSFAFRFRLKYVSPICKYTVYLEHLHFSFSSHSFTKGETEDAEANLMDFFERKGNYLT